MSGMDAGGKGSNGGKAKKGGFFDGLKSFGASLLEGFANGVTVNVSSSSTAQRAGKPGVSRKDPVTANELPRAARQIHRSLSVWRQAADEKAAAGEQDRDEAKADAKADAATEVDGAAVDDEQQQGDAGAATEAEADGGNAATEAAAASDGDETNPEEDAKADGEDKPAEEAAADPAHEGSKTEAKPPLSVAAKLKGVHRKIFRTETTPQPGGGPPPQVNVPGSGNASEMANAGASQASTIAMQPAPGARLGTAQLGGNAQLGAMKPVVNIQPLIGKVQQAKAMVDIWVTKPNVPKAAGLQAMLGGVIPKLQELQNGQFPAKILEEKMKAAAKELADIEVFDEEYKFYSLGQAGQTLLNAQKQLTVSDVKPFEWEKSRVDLWPAFQRQVQEQQDGINAQLAASWSDNREKYKAGAALGAGKGRSAEGTKLQKEYQKRTGPLGGDAAPHNSDQIAGGCADPTGVPAERSVNSSIGPQWTDPKRIGSIDKAVEQLKATEGDPGLAVTQMNVQLTAKQV